MEKRPSKPRRLASLVALGAGAACSQGKPDLRVEAVEARLSRSLVGVCAIYLTVANGGDAEDALASAEVELPGAVTQLHAMERGRMVERTRLVVPARGALALRPGGPHVMVFNLPEETGPGAAFQLRLRFERSGERRIAVVVGGEGSAESDTRAVSRRTGSAK